MFVSLDSVKRDMESAHGEEMSLESHGKKTRCIEALSKLGSRGGDEAVGDRLGAHLEGEEDGPDDVEGAESAGEGGNPK